MLSRRFGGMRRNLISIQDQDDAVHEDNLDYDSDNPNDDDEDDEKICTCCDQERGRQGRGKEGGWEAPCNWCIHIIILIIIVITNMMMIIITFPL